MSIGSIFISLIIFIMTSAIIYATFENMGTLGGFIACYISSIINAFSSGTSSAGGLTFVLAIIPALIETVIYKAIYDKSSSFGEFIKNVL